MGTFIPSEDGAYFNPRFDSGTVPLARSTSLLLKEENLTVICEQLDRIDRHIADVRELISKQIELVDKDKLKGRNAARFQSLLITLNDLLATYQNHRGRLIATLD